MVILEEKSFVANLCFQCLQSGVHGVNLGVDVIVLVDGVGVKLVTRLYQKVVVGQKGGLILQHGFFNLGFLPFKSWSLNGLDVSQRSFLGEVELLLSSLFWIML